MFVISFDFKGIKIHIRKHWLDCTAAKLYDEQNALLHVAYITRLRDFKNIFPIPHLLNGSTHILIGHCLDRVIWGDMHQKSKPLKKIKLDNFEGHWSFCRISQKQSMQTLFQGGNEQG